MIQITRLNNKEYYINNDLIETLESTPDTVITLTSGKKFVIKETPEEVIKRIIKFKKRVITMEREV